MGETAFPTDDPDEGGLAPGWTPPPGVLVHTTARPRRRRHPDGQTCCVTLVGTKALSRDG